MQMNMFFGLVLDIIFVAVIKAATRRRRPTVNDDIFSIGPDKFRFVFIMVLVCVQINEILFCPYFSFPSGHASRAFFILFFFTVLDPVSLFFWPPLFAWATSVALSRLLLYRHHILDITAGIVLGAFEAILLGWLWMGKDTANWVMSWISDENLPGSATQEEVF